MLNSNYFYHGHLKKYIILFGVMFDAIAIVRRDSSNNQQKKVKVPLSYAPKDKLLARIKEDPSFDKPDAISLPRMSFEIVGYAYDGTRKINKNYKFSKNNTDTTNSSGAVYSPVPYDLTFELNVLAKNAEDGAQIVEQILPYFTPDWTNTVKLIEGLDISTDIPLILNSVTSSDTYEGSYEERRVITWTLTFTMKAYFFGPMKEKKVIKMADTTINISGFDELDASNPEYSVSTFPGLTAGLATGTISTTGTDVVGANTLFSTEAKVGSYIEADGQFRKVVSISNNTHMTIASPYSPDLVAAPFKTTVTGLAAANSSTSVPPQYISETDNWGAFAIITSGT